MVDTFRRSSYISQTSPRPSSSRLSDHLTGHRRDSNDNVNDDDDDNDTNVNDLITIDERPMSSDVHVSRGEDPVASPDDGPHHHLHTTLNKNQKYPDTGGAPLKYDARVTTTAVAELIVDDGDVSASIQPSSHESSLGGLTHLLPPLNEQYTCHDRT